MDFVKHIFATIIGVLVTFVIIFVVFLVFIGALVQQSTSQSAAIVPDNSVLYMSLDHEIVEKTESNPFGDLNIPGYGASKSIGLNDILKRIQAAKEDDNIKGIYLNPSTINVGFASLKEIRDALVDFKTSKKFIVAYSEMYSQKAYYLASVADKIYVNPEGAIDFRGLSSSVVFMKDALDKLGVEMQVVKVGTYKSAVEPFLLNEMSSANREQVTSYLNSIYASFLTDIAEGRKISTDSLDRIADAFLVRNAEDAVKYKFVDAKLYKDELLDEIKDRLKVEKDKDISAVSLLTYSPKEKENSSKNKIAVLYAYGNIVDGEGTTGDIGGDKLSRQLRKLRKDDDIKAVVLRVNSPGGSALASDIIWREVELTRKVKPVMVSMGDYAASGGYYIAAAADSIFAEKGTLTGSIGVFGMIPNFKGLLNDKLGIHIDEVSTGKFSNLMSDMDRPMTAEERSIVQLEVDRIYNTFMKRVADGRKISVQRVDSIGQGRVWTGNQALELGLVDKIGNVQRAVQAAAYKAKLADYAIVELPEKEDPFSSILSTSKEKIKTWLFAEELGDYQKYIYDIRNALQHTGMQARIPYTIEIY
ncbi:signal peptide peptidase SppA [Sphingobacterium alkalisoli]|uniref:Signal peptide peptidase SppA n=1 Tax=Sphingobacterium alkalisoli TaxID=1874115 RepID=A0A4U0H512_9SPHI|nr:signal peptide peptidase SppA [Sphingobacterium alkalisoli]TJY66811.1 signal peptide peptidase SppA [Sphingobacterium alkalisoli]GGH14060.1 signal peptide peptidase SppA [Sphingobacterium alkalisoli]